MKKLNLTGLSWYAQAAVFGGLAVLLYLGFWFGVTRGTRAEANTVGEEVAKLKATNAKAQAASQRVGEFRAAYARAQADYSELLSLLPEHRELLFEEVVLRREPAHGEFPRAILHALQDAPTTSSASSSRRWPPTSASSRSRTSRSCRRTRRRAGAPLTASSS